jgi:hypothetical protein
VQNGILENARAGTPRWWGTAEAPMSYKMKISAEGTYLHAIVTGANTRDNVASYLKEIQRECKARNCFRVLIEERLEGPRLGTLEVYQIASEGSDRAKGAIEAIAYVDVNAEGKLMKFAETVAVNRGLPVMMFSTVSDAEQWLRKMDARS